MRHITGDTSESVYIEFDDYPNSSIFNTSIEGVKSYQDDQGIMHSRIEYTNDENHISWSLDMTENSKCAVISYIRF